MQNFQPSTQFLADMGHLLADQATHRQSAQQRQALANLAEYLSTARRHHGLTWATLAQSTGKSEVEIYALEQGLLPYAQIDLPFLCDLANALGEEVETLTLLLGHAAVSFLPHPNPGDGIEVSARNRTNSQRFHNWLTTLPGINPLHKRCLNLVDSLPEGRLFSYRQTNYGVNHCIGATLALLACLLLLWVSTYSLSGLLHAQSYATLLQASVPHTNEPPDHSSTTLTATGTINRVTSARALRPSNPRRSQQSAKAAVYPADEEQISTMSLFLPPMPVDSQQCALRTMSKFTLCRV